MSRGPPIAAVSTAPKTPMARGAFRVEILRPTFAGSLARAKALSGPPSRNTPLRPWRITPIGRA
eukprot:6926982-Lingulodinium_polyedra.AAC.1